MQAEESLRILVGTEGDSLPLMEINAGETEASEQWDYVLVADRRTQRNPRQACQQRRFLEELRTKGFHYKVCWLSAWLGVGHRGQVCPGGPETRLGPRA